MIKRLPQFDIGDEVRIIWDDAFCLSGGYWRVMDDVYETHSEATIGYYLQATDRFVTVAQTIAQGQDEEEISWGGAFSIPVGFIVSIDKI